jgi:type IV secretory pathway VirB3-like protein
VQIEFTIPDVSQIFSELTEDIQLIHNVNLTQLAADFEKLSTLINNETIDISQIQERLKKTNAIQDLTEFKPFEVKLSQPTNLTSTVAILSITTIIVIAVTTVIVINIMYPAIIPAIFKAICKTLTKFFSLCINCCKTTICPTRRGRHLDSSVQSNERLTNFNVSAPPVENIMLEHDIYNPPNVHFRMSNESIHVDNHYQQPVSSKRPYKEIVTQRNSNFGKQHKFSG